MDLTEGTIKEKNARAKKMMLWFGIVSLLMSFAGWTSAYVVSSSRPDWLTDIQLPQAFFYSTITIIMSSVSIYFAKKLIEKGDRSLSIALLCITFLLGVTFIVFQFAGFSQIMNAFGYHFTGPTSNVTVSFIYLIAVVHIVHVVIGLIVLLVLIYNHFKEKYKPGQTLGLELGAVFWHFLGFLWIYLILFFYFN